MATVRMENVSKAFTDAKLVVAAASPEAQREFARVMGRLPGIELSDAATSRFAKPSSCTCIRYG